MLRLLFKNVFVRNWIKALPWQSWDSLPTHHLCESLELSGVACGWDGVEGSECGRGDFGLEIDHVEYAADTGVGGEGLHHEVGVRVLVRIRLILEHAEEEGGELLR